MTPDTAQLTLGALLRMKRAEKGWSQQGVATSLEQAGFPVTRAAVCQWENDLRRPSLDHLHSLLELLDFNSWQRMQAFELTATQPRRRNTGGGDEQVA
jgi:transcriptional regulator with XRE-family HTH domain